MVFLSFDFEGLKRLAKLGLVSQKALPSAKRVAAWKKQIAAASRAVRLNKWQYNEEKSVYERDTGGRREELVTACVHAMLDLLDWTNLKEETIKKLVLRIFWFHFPKDEVFERNSKVTNAIKSFKEKKRRSSLTTRQ